MAKNPESSAPLPDWQPVRKGIGDDKGWLIEDEDSLQKIQDYKSLKLKQANDEPLTAEEFDKMVDFEIEQELADNPKLDEVFSPEDELEKIRHLPQADKRAALDDWKDKYHRQKSAIAEMSILLENTLLFDPDTPLTRLNEIIQQFVADYGLSGKQRRLTLELIRDYKKTRYQVIVLSNQFSDDVKLVHHITNVKPRDDIAVSIGPMSVDIEASGYDAGRIYEESDDPVEDFQVTAFAAKARSDDNTPYIVINRDKILSRHHGQKILLHETEHHKNGLFRGIFEESLPTRGSGANKHVSMSFSPYDFFEPVSSDNNEPNRQRYGVKDTDSNFIFYSNQSPEVKEKMLDNLLKQQLHDACRHTKDEWTAKLQNTSAEKMLHYLNAFEPGGGYDYFDEFRTRAKRYSKNQYKDDAIFKTKMDVGLKEIEAAYQKQVKESTDAFMELMRAGFSQEEAIAFLQDKDFEDWPKTVRRLEAFLEAKNCR
jgi:hypothetical protein